MSLYSNIHKPQAEAQGFLRATPLFSTLGEADLTRLADRVKRRTFASGATLFHQDMPGMVLYIIETGSVRIFSIGRTGQELTFDIFGAGEIFGELSLLDDKHHSASAITLSETTVWLLPKSDLDELLEKNLLFTRALIRILVNRIRIRAVHAEVMTFQNVQGRLAYILLYLAERHGRTTANGVEVNIPLTQVELAALVGATRESVYKSLATLRSQKMVTVEGLFLTITNPAGLQRLIQDRGR